MKTGNNSPARIASYLPFACSTFIISPCNRDFIYILLRLFHFDHVAFVVQLEHGPFVSFYSREDHPPNQPSQMIHHLVIRFLIMVFILM